MSPTSLEVVSEVVSGDVNAGRYAEDSLIQRSLKIEEETDIMPMRTTGVPISHASLYLWSKNGAVRSLLKVYRAVHGSGTHDFAGIWLYGQ